jgi:hypothetical protein
MVSQTKAGIIADRLRRGNVEGRATNSPDPQGGHLLARAGCRYNPADSDKPQACRAMVEKKKRALVRRNKSPREHG